MARRTSQEEQDFAEGRNSAEQAARHGLDAAVEDLRQVREHRRRGSWGGSRGPGSPAWIEGYASWVQEQQRKVFPGRLVDFSGLRQKRWDLDMVRVAQDWALEHGYEPAEAWLKETTPPERDTGEPQLDPAVVRAAMEAGIEPMSMGYAQRRLVEYLGLDYVTANAVIEVIKGRIDPEKFESVERWVRQCYHRPSQPELKMAALNEIVNGFGVEAIGPDLSGDTIAEYIDAGDTYNETIIRLVDMSQQVWWNSFRGRELTSSGRYIIASYGDVVEAWERAHLEDEELEDEE